MTDKHHDGVDYKASVGTPIYAVASGTVIYAGENGGYGKVVSMRHDGGITTLFAHLSEVSVSVGDEVPFRLIIQNTNDGKVDLEIICYREGLQPWDEAKSRIMLPIQHFRKLQSSFKGQGLYVGPDTLNYPSWPDTAPDEWMRIA